MMSKSSKIGFKIKLSSETSEKLRNEKIEVVENEIVQRNSTTVDGKTEPVDDEIIQRVSISNDQIPKGELSKESGGSEGVLSEVQSETLVADTNKELTEDSSKVTSEPTLSHEVHVDDHSKSSYFEAYAPYINYEDGLAIYTDPSTGTRYTWNEDKNEWVPETKNETEQGSEEKHDVTYEDGVATYKDRDGTVFVWDSEKKAWFPKIDEDFLAQYQMSYGFVDNSAENEKKVDKSKDSVESVEKLQGDEKKSEPNGLKRKHTDPPKWFDISDDRNTSVYVSNLPLDITEEEFVDLMQKCGLVMRDPATQKMKIKLYNKPNSKQLKGDALCTYIKIESVELALNILDGYTFNNHRLRVEKAQFEMKGEFNPSLKPKKKKRKEKEKIKKMQEKLFDWRPEKFRGERSKHEKVVIVKHLFEPQIFDKQVDLILEYQEDLREECSKLGEVRKIVLFDRHPEGVAQIIMKEPEEADNVVKMMNGRWFNKRQLTAEIWDGKTKYKMEETDADLNKRLNSWENYLEQDKTKQE